MRSEVSTAGADQDLGRIVEELKRELIDGHRREAATAEVLRVISRSPTEVQPVFNAIVESAVKLCDGLFSALFQFDGELIHQVAQHNYNPQASEEVLRAYPRPPTRGRGSGRAILECAVVHIPDFQLDPEYEGLAGVIGYRSGLFVPMLRGGAPIGVIMVARSAPGKFSDTEIELLKIFADQAVIAIENTRLFEAEQVRTKELKASLEYQTATSEVLNVISRSPSDLQPVLDSIVKTAAHFCKAQLADIALIEGENIRIRAGFGKSGGPTGQVVALDRATVMGRAVRDGSPVHIVDMQRAGDEFRTGRELAVKYGHRAIVGVPLMREARAIGALILRRTEAVSFSEQQITLLQTFADQAVIAIENTRLFEAEQARSKELRESLEYQTATADLLAVISRSPSKVQPVFDSIVKTAQRLCHADHAFVLMAETSGYRLAAAHDVAADWIEGLKDLSHAPGRSSVTGRVALDRRTVHIHDVLADPEYSLAVSRRHVRTNLGVPLMRNGNVAGVIILGRTRVEPFTPRQIALVETFADQAVIAIENARLFEEVQARTRELTESLEYQTATSDVLSIISRSPSQLQPVLDAIVATAARLCQCDNAYLFTLQEGKFRPVAYDARSEPEFLSYLRANPIGPDQRGSITARAARERRTIHVPDTSADPEYGTGPITASSHHTVLSVPLLREGSTVGVISMDRLGVNPFGQKQIELVETFADQAVIAIENTRLFQAEQARTKELTEALEQQTAASEVLKVISSSAGELEPVFQTILENAVRICDAQFGTLFRYDGKLLHWAAGVGTPPTLVEFQKQRGPFLPEPTSKLHDLLQTRKVQHVVDAAADAVPGVAAKFGGARSIVHVPMLKDDELVGAITIYRQEVRPFTEKQIELVTSFANQAVIAIENTRLLNELRESLQQQTATADVLKVISRATFDLPRVLDTLVESAASLCDSHDTAILQKDGDLLRIVSHRGHIPSVGPVGEATLPLTRGAAVGRAVLDRQTIHLADVQSETEEYPEGSAIARRLGFRAILTVPLVGAGEAVGAIILRRSEVRPFTDRQIELLQTFADQAVIAIENTRLFEEVQARTKELQESLDWQTATSEVLGVISRSPNEVQPVLDTIVATAQRLCQAERAIVWRLEGETFRAVAHRGQPEERVESVLGARMPMSRGSMSGRATLARRAVQVEDVATDPELVAAHAFSRAGNIHTVLAVPLLLKGHPIGVITLSRTRVAPFDDKQVALVESFADQAVIAIENSRLFEAEQASKRELARSVEELESLGKVSQAVTNSTRYCRPFLSMPAPCRMQAVAPCICSTRLPVSFGSQPLTT
jgi:GAF domain-containing protein